MDVKNENLIRFWQALNHNKVQYIMIGALPSVFKTGRAQDLADVLELEKIRKIRGESRTT